VLLGAEGIALLGMLLGMTGCGEIDAQARNAEGVRLFEQCRYPEAARQFQEAMYDDPRGAVSYYNLAATYHRTGLSEHRQNDLNQAESYYRLSLDRNPDYADCYRGLAVLLAQEGRTDEAFRLLEGWSQREPCSADARIELARLNQEFGNRQGAEEHLLEAVTIDPDNPRALTALGKLREDSGNSAQALANYQRSLGQDNRQPEVAARVSVLQVGSATCNCTPTPAGSPGTQVVQQPTPTPLR
jgi:tetratricopeptide (TPR) repeat protein